MLRTIKNVIYWILGKEIVDPLDKKVSVPIRLNGRQLKALDKMIEASNKYNGKKLTRSEMMQRIIRVGYVETGRQLNTLNKKHHQVRRNPFSDHSVPPPPKPKKKTIPTLTLVKGGKK